MFAIAFGADVNEETNEDLECITPLILACQCSHLKNQFAIIQCLLENEASPNQSVSKKSQHHHQHIPYRTPLVTYIKQAHEQKLDMRIIRLLIGYGARVSFSRGRGMLHDLFLTDKISSFSKLLQIVFFKFYIIFNRIHI